jgi:hypothetical protein
LIRFYEEHRDHRDKFEILAFHDASAKSFEELDPKLVPLQQTYWQGKPLPFPILLDSTGRTIEEYGIHAFPTVILIDPEGRLVKGGGEAMLESKLPPVPLAERLPRALDGNVTFFFDQTPLDKAVEMLARSARIPIRLDPDGLKAAGVAPDAPVPMTLSAILTLRSALDLALDPFGLTFEEGKDALVITRRPPGDRRPAAPSAPQKMAAERIEKVLGRKFSFDFRAKPLSEVATTFEGLTSESFVLDPTARKAGAIDPAATVSGADGGLPLGEALGKLLKPLGMTYVIRDEAVVLTRKAGQE